jgi:tetratricopeptide (TPR) repeat protein
MHPDPDWRYRDPSALADDVQRFLDDEPVSVYRDPRTTRLRRWIGRHQKFSVAAILSFVFASAAVSIGIVAKLSFETAALREQDRIRFVAGRAPFENLLTLGVVQYLAKDRAQAAETYDNLIREAEKRVTSAFATETDIALLGRCYFCRGFVEMPGQLPAGQEASSEMSLIEKIVSTQQKRGLLTAVLDTLDQSHARNAEAWLDKAVSTFDSIEQPGKLIAREKTARLYSMIDRAAMRMQVGRYTEALMDFDRALILGESSLAAHYRWCRDVTRMAAEQEQSNLAWSRPPKAQDPKTMRLAEYLAQHEGVSDAAVYNAACVFSLASLDDHVTATERERRASKAVAYLTRITDHGYFKGPKQGHELRNDHDLDALRSRSDFQGVLSRAPPSP